MGGKSISDFQALTLVPMLATFGVPTRGFGCPWVLVRPPFLGIPTCVQQACAILQFFKDVCSEMYTFGLTVLSLAGKFELRFVSWLSFAKSFAAKCFSEELLCPFGSVLGVLPEALEALQL